MGARATLFGAMECAIITREAGTLWVGVIIDGYDTQNSR
jgi:hypothetical protein